MVSSVPIVPYGTSGTTSPGIVGGVLMSMGPEGSDFPMRYTSMRGLSELIVTVIVWGVPVRGPSRIDPQAQ